MNKFEVIEVKCKGCGLCIAVCPKNILRYSDKVNQMGYTVVECIDQEACILCKSCAIVCPDVAIKLNKPDKK